ncbi:MAG: NifU family protein [Erysipelotrichaceae bacterium]|nr:NifU family protein [Erysipelotrichaceae bacterium]
MKEFSETEVQIIQCLERLRPYIQHDGGDLEYIGFEDGVVHIKLWGACVGCGLVDMTLKDGIESFLKEEVDGVESVVLDNPYTPLEEILNKEKESE